MGRLAGRLRWALGVDTGLSLVAREQVARPALCPQRAGCPPESRPPQRAHRSPPDAIRPGHTTTTPPHTTSRSEVKCPPRPTTQRFHHLPHLGGVSYTPSVGGSLFFLFYRKVV